MGDEIMHLIIQQAVYKEVGSECASELEKCLNSVKSVSTDFIIYQHKSIKLFL